MLAVTVEGVGASYIIGDWELQDPTSGYHPDLPSTYENVTFSVSWRNVVCTNATGNHLYEFTVYDDGIIDDNAVGMQITVTFNGLDNANYTDDTVKLYNINGASYTLLQTWTDVDAASAKIVRSATLWEFFIDGEKVWQESVSGFTVSQAFFKTWDVYTRTAPFTLPANFDGSFYVTISSANALDSGISLIIPVVIIAMVLSLLTTITVTKRRR